ncbi:hypothetical protein OOK58_42145 [Streptomyces sp. NBC_01728]|uniref:hypothetical protein n=1 Tax=unclassified Streptomyces TaxID=2593676 RepID=UPI00225626C1|nr:MULTISPECIES: hypothetical protein [unclassified Streptomyces]MCX4458517.1 hypothetical protein [Streptomyces sp. NBC_01719]MCX4497874.1 hypothetical protein [Streptomyces sp. NBC_01728]
MSEEPNEEVKQLMQAIEGLFKGTEEPAERFKRLSELLDGWPDLHSGVRLLRQQVGEQLYDNGNGLTYGAIGDLIGVTESRARHIVKGITNPSRQKRKAEEEEARRAERERRGKGDGGVE